MTQLTARQLQPGDVMLKLNSGNITNQLIALGQRLSGQANAQVTHAGLMFDSNYIVEAQGSGIEAHDVRVQNAQLGYIVFRARNQRLAQGAGTCAKMMFDIQGRHQTMKYNLSGAVKSLFGSGRARSAASMDDLLTDVLSGKGHPFFCSQLVVYVYQFVAEQNGIRGSQIFQEHDAKVSPATLASMLASNSNFTEVGYMLPGAR
ncbi:MAG: hypothetical protein JNK87_36855 [Bryobacterales bacterium]|nr:hypothetical protein [Bryobacterales bacterium]